MVEHLRNIAIIAHVDHGKTTLVDQLLRQSQTLEAREEIADRAMDSNPLERERGITILSKNTAIRWGDYRINIVDTPGHADFGGEVERVLSMVDSVLLIVDAVDGPMPQTRFVTRKAFDHGLKPIVVINKVDRDGARPHAAVEATFDLMDSLGATDEQLDFPIIYASALLGRSGHNPDALGPDMTPLFEAIVKHCPAPDVDQEGPLQLQVSALDYSSYVGAIGIGRIKRGVLKRNSVVTVVSANGEETQEKIGQVFGFLGLKRIEVAEARAGDIVAFSGIDHPRISDTLCDPGHPQPLPALTVDEPTIQMSFETNDSPFAGREGKFVTSRQVRERLMREAIHNVALRVEDTDDPECFLVSGRGELHLSVLLETMRREGYELAVSRPHVIVRETETGSPGRARRGAAGHAARRGGASAPRLPGAQPRPDRLPVGVPQRDLRHGALAPRVRPLRTRAVRPARPAAQRRADLQRDRQGPGLCALQPPGEGPAHGRARGRGVRRPGRGDPQPG